MSAFSRSGSRRSSFVRAAAAVTLGALSLAACSTSTVVDPMHGASGAHDASPAASETVRIGVEAPITGEQSVTGAGMVNGAKLAAEALNAEGGIGGRKVQIVPIDDAADAATGVAAARAAIEAGLDAVVGPYNSAVGVQTLPLYEKAGLVPMRLTSNSSTNGMGYTLQPMDYQIAPAASTGLTTWLKARSVAIIYDASQNYTSTIASDLKAELEKAGVSIPVFEPIAPGASSYREQVAKAATASPDVVYAATYFPEGGAIARDLHDSKASARCVVDYASDDPGFVTTAGTEAAQACAVVGVPSPADFPRGTKFVADYVAAFGSQPGTWSPYTYDSVLLLAQAARSVGSFEQKALDGYLGAVKDWPGVTGSVTIDASNGNREPGTVVYLDVDSAGSFTVNRQWAAAVGADF